MADHQQLPDQVVSCRIHAPIEVIWNEITKVGIPQKPIFDTVLECDFKPGSKLKYYSADRKRVFVVGEVIEYAPPTLFRHSYWFTTWKTPKKTVVTWRIRECGDYCEVLIEHSGWSKEHSEYQSTQRGWQKILALLKELVETGRISFSARISNLMMNRLAFLLPKATLADRY